jgi:hypothetical protein
MAKFTKNSGFSRQDAAIGQMQREAKQAPSNNSAAAVEMAKMTSAENVSHHALALQLDIFCVENKNYLIY